MRARQYIENAIDRHTYQLTKRKISANTGICTTILSRYFSGKCDLTFVDFLKLSQYLPNVDLAKALDLLTDDYIENTRPANKRALLLYLLNHGRLNRLDELAATLTNDRNYSAWGSLIGAFIKFRIGELADFELSEHVSTVKSYSADITAFKYVMVAYDMHATNSHNVFAHFAAKAERALHDVESKDMRQHIGDLLNRLT